jgi:hypothetical protein
MNAMYDGIAYFAMAVSYTCKIFMKLTAGVQVTSGANVIKLYTTVS